MPLGAHLPTGKGLVAAVEHAQTLGLDCLQIFSKSPKQWKAAPLDEEKIAAFRAKWRESKLSPLVVHDSYLINLAAPVDETLQKSRAAFVDEIERADALGADWLVTHCGAHLKSGEEAGIQKLIESVRLCLDATADLRVKIALENTAAQGTCLGGPFEHLGQVLRAVNSERLGVCFDSCHAFAAGHDLHSELEKVVADFDEHIGLQHLALVHLNDSKGELGGHLDRHEHIGEGKIGREAMRLILNHPKLRDLPFVLETPDVETEIARNIKAVRELQTR